MSNFGKKMLLVLAACVPVAVVIFAIIGLLNHVVVGPQEIGVMENRITGDVSILEPGFHTWPLEKGWTLFATKVSVYSTDSYRVCINDAIIYGQYNKETLEKDTFEVSVCASIIINPDTLIYLYDQYNDSFRYDNVIQSALYEATATATNYLFSFDNRQVDRQQVQEAIKTVLEFYMDSDPEPMMRIDDVTVTELNL